MKRILLVMLAIAICVSMLSACGNSDSCRHSWERTDNLNKYTAMDKCTKCGTTRKYIDADSVTASGGESGLTMLQYAWSGYGISTKTIEDCALGYAILECLSELEETGAVSPKISDEVMDEMTGDLPAERGTMWLDCGSVGLFRLTPGLTEISRVQTHYGEGEVLALTDTLKDLISQAWSYYPRDTWYGSYKDGEVTLNQVYKGDTIVDWVTVKKLKVKNEDGEGNIIKLGIEANESVTAEVKLTSAASSDYLGSIESKTVELVKGKEVTVEFEFYGFDKYPYEVVIRIDNTNIILTVDPVPSE